MPRWLLPWIVPVILVVGVLAGIIGGVPGVLAVVAAVLLFAGWLRGRQLKASGERDEVGYPRLSDLLRPRR